MTLLSFNSGLIFAESCVLPFKSIGLEILREEELVWSGRPSCQRQWKISKLKTEIKHQKCLSAAE